MPNAARGVKYVTISNFSTSRFLIQGFILKKIDFFQLLLPKCFKNKPKSFEKCLKKFENIFYSKSIVMYPFWSRYIPKDHTDSREYFSTPLHAQNDFLKFFKNRKYSDQSILFLFLSEAIQHEKFDFELEFFIFEKIQKNILGM